MRKLILIASMISMILSLTVGAWAQAGLKEMPPGKWWTNRRLIVELQLSPEQQASIDEVWTRCRRNLIDQKAELEKRQLDLEEMLAGDRIDEAAAMKAFDAVQEARGVLERSTFQMRIQIKNLLTPPQQRRLEAAAERLRQQRTRIGNAAAGPPVPPIKKVPR